MTFQFLCPQGHLLEGDESQMGQACDCPMCGMRFIIPTVQPAGPAAYGGALYGGGQYGGGQYGGQLGGGQFGAGGYGGGQSSEAAPNPFDFQGGRSQAGSFLPPGVEEEPYDDEPQESGIHVGDGDRPGYDAEPAAPRILHIPCPNGHELETPEEMVGQDVICPFCGEQFQLRLKDSVEHKRERALERELREIKSGQMWFNWAIVIAVLVVLGLIVLIALSMQGRS